MLMSQTAHVIVPEIGHYGTKYLVTSLCKTHEISTHTSHSLFPPLFNCLTQDNSLIPSLHSTELVSFLLACEE